MPYSRDRSDDRLNAWDDVENWGDVCPEDDEAAAAWYAARDYADEYAWDDEAEAEAEADDDDEADAWATWADDAESSDCIDPTIY